MAGAKTQGVELKTNVQGLADDFKKMADPNAIANAAANNALGGDPNAMLGNALGGNAAEMLKGGDPNAMLGNALGGNTAEMLKGGDPKAMLGNALGGNSAAALGSFMKGGGTDGYKPKHLRSIKKYKREYKQSIRDLRKTRKNILRCIKNMI